MSIQRGRFTRDREAVISGHLRHRDFAVLWTVSKKGERHTVGVTYGVPTGRATGHLAVVIICTAQSLG
jgi:hypothetical protein